MSHLDALRAAVNDPERARTVTSELLISLCGKDATPTRSDLALTVDALEAVQRDLTRRIAAEDAREQVELAEGARILGEPRT